MSSSAASSSPAIERLGRPVRESLLAWLKRALGGCKTDQITNLNFVGRNTVGRVPPENDPPTRVIKNEE
jgi:hypothetical protein